MNIGKISIRRWDVMKSVFFEKYKDYWIDHDLRKEVFKISQKEDEILEYLVERFTIISKDLNCIIWDQTH